MLAVGFRWLAFLPMFLLDLLDAIAKNDRSLVLNLLCNSNIDFRKPIDDHGNTFLHSAAIVLVSIKNRIGVTPLHVAALNNTEACAMLLKYDADVNSTTNLGYTPLQYAAKHGCYKACRMLCILERTNVKGRPVFFINEDLNINWQNCYNETALHLVIDARNAAIMQSKNKWPRCEDRYTRIVKFLLNLGADLSIKNHSGDTPLHIAARYEMEYIVKLFLHYNAVIHVRNDRSETAINVTKGR